jgi:hypothetical protein
MTHRSFELHFAGSADVQLVEARLIDRATGVQRITVRGKTPGAIRDAGTFQWTSAVRGLCILLAKAKMIQALGGASNAANILGHQGSLAASLDYAITKQPIWIRDMFGNDPNGNTLAQRLISRTNPNRKRPGPVILGLNERAVLPADITITWNGKRAESAEVLKTLLRNLGDTEQAEVSEQGLGGPGHKIAA